MPRSTLHKVVVSTTGGMMVGTILSAILYGVTLVQTYQYYDHYWGDRAALKVFVAVLWVLDTLALILAAHMPWWYLINNYGRVESIGTIVWSLGLEVVVTVFVAFFTQCFFTIRLWTLSRRNKILVLAISTLALIELITGLYFVVAAWRAGVRDDIKNFAWPATLSLASGIAADIIITATLCYYLRRGRTGLKSSDRVINVLMLYSVNTGLITSICASMTMILNLVYPENYYDTIFYFVQSKCYVNSVLASLNSRSALRDEINASEDTSPARIVDATDMRSLAGTDESQKNPISFTRTDFPISNQTPDLENNS